MKGQTRLSHISTRTSYRTNLVKCHVLSKLGILSRWYQGTTARVGLVVSDNWQDFSPKPLTRGRR